jgi:NADH-quinone oxidoreductase subunit L
MLAGDWIVNFLEPVVGTAPEKSPPIPALMISLIVVLIVAVGVAAAWYLVERQDVPREAPQDVSLATRAARAELYGNEINDGLVIRPGGRLVAGLTLFDRHGVDGVVEGTALGVGGTGSILRLAQTGFVRSYALSVLAGAVLVVVALLAVNLR